MSDIMLSRLADRAVAALAMNLGSMTVSMAEQSFLNSMPSESWEPAVMAAWSRRDAPVVMGPLDVVVDTTA